jgi:hypothetical protein
MGTESRVDKDCGDHTIYNPYSYIYNIRFQQRTKMPIWTGSLIIYQRPSKMSATI